jgi:hypothetical protein
MDYAQDLLGGRETGAPNKDYASELLGPVTAIEGRSQLTKPKQAQKQGMSLSDIDLANADNNEGTADFTTLSKAAMVDDPGTKIRILAKARFPDMPEKDAMSRYGIVEGVPIYLGKDDKIYRETPTGVSGFAKLAAAQVIGHPGETVGSTVGAIAGAATPVTAPGGAAIGAAGGRAIDKLIGNVAFDEPQSALGNAADIAESAVLSGGSTAVGSALSKFLERNVAKDIKKLDTARTADLTQKAGAVGVELNPAQTTDLPSLKGKYDVLASMPTSRDIIAESAKKQSRQAYKAVDDFLEKVSPVDGLDEAGTIAREGAKKVISNLTKERSDAARPLYKKAFDEFQGIPPEFMPAAEELMSRPTMRQAGRMAKRLAEDEGVILDSPQNSLLGMHYMKLSLDKMIGDEARGGFSKTSRGALIGLKKELVQFMDELSPTYAKARETFSHFTPNIISVEDGIISKVAGLGDEQAHRASQMVFGGNTSPVAVERTRNLFVKSGLENDYNAMLRSYLQDTFEQAGKATMGGGGVVNQAPKWQVAMTGNPRQYRILEKAMSPTQFQGFKDMMDVFEAMGRTAGAGAGSQTMGRQEGAALLRRESGSGVVGQVAGASNPLTWGPALKNWLQEVRVGSHAEKLAEVMTSPEGMKRLKELKQLSPNDKRFIAGTANLFGISVRPRAGYAAPEEETSQ